MEILQMEKRKEEEFLNGKMEASTKAITNKIKNMGSVNTLTKMGKLIKVAGKMDIDRAKELLLTNLDNL
jgi:hypothetical protein